MKSQISIIIPLYNEEDVLPHLIERLDKLMSSMPELTFEIVLINDGSTDNTEQKIQVLGLSDNRYHIISLSRNYGHQIALSAGLKLATATEAVMILDGDLQDPPELLKTFYGHYKAGFDIVYGIRKKRKETFFKRALYHIFYRILKRISNIYIPLDSGDFSLISRKAVDILNSMPEESRYIRGMRSWIGFKQIGVEYEREERFAGSSKYSYKELFRLAYNGIFNFSEFPIKFISNLGFFAVAISSAYIIYNLIKRFFWGDVPEGFTAIISLITLFSGIQLLCIGILGEYILRIFFQTKNRPLFIVKSEIVNKQLNA